MNALWMNVWMNEWMNEWIIESSTQETILGITTANNLNFASSG